MTTAWKKEEEALEVGDGEGDILSVLARIRRKYTAHANRLVNRADKQQRGLTDEEGRGYDYYTDAADKVQALINQ